MDKHALGFLTDMPSNYGAFNYALNIASIEELKEALRILEGRDRKKTARKRISARIRKLEKEQK